MCWLSTAPIFCLPSILCKLYLPARYEAEEEDDEQAEGVAILTEEMVAAAGGSSIAENTSGKRPERSD